MTEYAFIQSDRWDTFVKECNDFIQKGWIPQGGISISNYRDREDDLQTVYAQAFVR